MVRFSLVLFLLLLCFVVLCLNFLNRVDWLVLEMLGFVLFMVIDRCGLLFGLGVLVIFRWILFCLVNFMVLLIRLNRICLRCVVLLVIIFGVLCVKIVFIFSFFLWVLGVVSLMILWISLVIFIFFGCRFSLLVLRWDRLRMLLIMFSVCLAEVESDCI